MLSILQWRFIVIQRKVKIQFWRLSFLCLLQLLFIKYPNIYGNLLLNLFTEDVRYSLIKASMNLLLIIVLPVDFIISIFYTSFYFICRYKLFQKYRLEPNNEWTWETNPKLWRVERWEIAKTLFLEYGIYLHLLIFVSTAIGPKFKLNSADFPSP